MKADTADTVQDRINRKAWSSWGARHWFGSLQGWTDPGEAAAVRWMADEVRNQPILDIGVGGGRTVPLLTAISQDYTAIDYMPEMVALCRRNHPGVRAHQMDARDMSAFADNSFALVMFSFNGIDAVDYQGRGAILSEIARVLRPGGMVLFSTHNMRGPSYRENLTRFLRLPRLSANPIAVGIDAARIVYNLPIAAFNYLRHAPQNREFNGYAIRVCAAHKFGIVIVYTEIAAQKRGLEFAGMRSLVTFGNLDEHELQEGADLTSINWFHFVARKL